MNTTSHDEENYRDPWQAFVRYAVASTQDGIPMVFPGQELGISTSWGYDHYERNLGKTIPHFKRYNSMMPAWGSRDFGNARLAESYAAVNKARAASPSLRSPNRWFLETGNPSVFGVAKWEAGARPVLAFVNLDPSHPQSASVRIPGELFKKLGLRENGVYQAGNLASRGGSENGRWGGGLPGKELLGQGIRVELNALPEPNAEAWGKAPYGPLYLEISEAQKGAGKGPLQ